MPEYDFILGSLHNLRGERDFYYLKYESEEQCLALYDRYLEELIELAAIPCFDIMAHIGYCRRYMRRQGLDIEMDMERFGDPHRHAAAHAHRERPRHRAQLLRPLGRRPRHLPLRAHPPPLPRLGGDIVTVGSDAHSPKKRRRRRGGGAASSCSPTASATWRATATTRRNLRGWLEWPRGGHSMPNLAPRLRRDGVCRAKGRQILLINI